ncbi:hypothetical protein AB0O22_25965 [Streptomyces sp. NPDC091204]|uniref:hypothetical protein n=1 Tax=Streptomyces sp. NPDC091204 TaxID=3155299 RepID=UPI00341876AA
MVAGEAPPSLSRAHQAVIRAVRVGELDEARIDRSVLRVLRLKQSLGLLDTVRGLGAGGGAAVGAVVGNPAHLTAADRIAERAPTGLAPPPRTSHAPRPPPRGHDAVLECTYDLGARSAQRARVDRLTATGVPVIAVTLRNPYDIVQLPDVTTSLALHSWSDTELRAAARVLAGAAAAPGRLPVAVPPLFPLGHGLQYPSVLVGTGAEWRRI